MIFYLEAITILLHSCSPYSAWFNPSMISKDTWIMPVAKGVIAAGHTHSLSKGSLLHCWINIQCFLSDSPNFSAKMENRVTGPWNSPSKNASGWLQIIFLLFGTENGVPVKEPSHSRLRCPLGRFFSQKMFKSKVLFLSEKRSSCQN